MIKFVLPHVVADQMVGMIMGEPEADRRGAVEELIAMFSKMEQTSPQEMAESCEARQLTRDEVLEEAPEEDIALAQQQTQNNEVIEFESAEEFGRWLRTRAGIGN